MPHGLVDGIRQRLSANNFPVGPTADRTWLLKDRLVYGSADCTIVDATHFDATLDLPLYWGAVRNDWRLGYHRVLAQNRVARHLAEQAKLPRAWVVVSSYYVSFFCAVELLRALGRRAHYFSEEEVAGMSSRAQNPSAVTLEVGNYVANDTFKPNDNNVLLRFAKTRARPHEFVWSEIGRAAQTHVDVTRSASARRFVQMISGADRWKGPSETRNEWNYADPGLYGPAGTRLAEQFAKLARDSDSAWKWGRSLRLDPTPANIVSSLAFIQHTLVTLMDQANVYLAAQIKT